jgi:hypothetical protein
MIFFFFLQRNFSVKTNLFWFPFWGYNYLITRFTDFNEYFWSVEAKNYCLADIN